jgi:hypothetical protein
MKGAIARWRLMRTIAERRGDRKNEYNTHQTEINGAIADE